MKVIKPIPFDISHLITSNVVEIYSAWSISTSYSKDDFVDYQTEIYQSLINSNLGNQPDTDPTKWQLVGPDNVHAMFDTQVSTITTSPSPINVTIQPNNLFNSIALFNLTATVVTVNVYQGSNPTPYYTKVINLDGTNIFDWYSYFFEPFNLSQETVLTDIPPYSNARLEVSIDNGSSQASVGILTYGNVYTIGKTQYGAGTNIIDYSVKDTDEYGNTTFVVRAFSKRMTANVFVDKSQTNVVYKLFSTLRATPCVWIGSQDSHYENTLVFGYYKDFSIEITYPSYSQASLEIEGLI